MTQKVYEAIAAVTAELGREGIGKDRRNATQGYNFRGIDEVYNALSPALSKHKLCILPRIITRDVAERQSAKGGVLFYVTVGAEFDFVSAEDGSVHVVRTYGEAMDSGDKATNKAMSAAYKYAAMQAFCIPTEGDNDADATTHEVAADKVKPKHDAVPDRITDAQRDTLMGLAQTAGKDMSSICSAYKIDSLKELRPAQYEKLAARLREESTKPDPKPAAKAQADQMLDDEIPF